MRRLRLGLAPVALLGAVAQAATYVPRQPPIAFFWETGNNSVKTIPQCSALQIFTVRSPTTNVQPTGPLYFTAAAPGYDPETQLVASDVDESFTWIADFPVGTQLLFAMTDSANNSGGAVGGYTIIPGSENCTSPGEVSRFTRTVYPDDRPCDEMAFELSGGVKPYTVSILVPGTGAYLNATGIDDTSFSIQNTIPAGQTYNLWVSDSNGSTTYVGYTKTSQLNQPGCNEAIRPNADSGTPVGTVVGAVIGSVLGALLIAAVAWWFVRRRNRQRAEQYRQQPPAATSEFRTADGRAPLVEPFRIPMAGAGAGAGATAAAGVDVFEDHSPNTDSFEKSTYPLSAADQHFFRSAQASAGVLPSALPPPSPHPHAYDPSANPYAHPYDAYDHGPYDPVASSPVDTAEYLAPSGPATSYGGEQRAAEEAADEAPAGDGTDGLAHPDQFEFRLPGESPTGTGALPWAQQQQSQGGGGGGGAYGHARDGRPY